MTLLGMLAWLIYRVHPRRMPAMSILLMQGRERAGVDSPLLEHMLMISSAIATLLRLFFLIFRRAACARNGPCRARAPPWSIYRRPLMIFNLLT
jgi:hypothetical protein